MVQLSFGRSSLLLITLCAIGITRAVQFPLRAPAGYGASQSTLKNTHFDPQMDDFGYNKKFSSLMEDEIPVWNHPYEGNSTVELSSVSDEYFTRVDHPLFPHHSVRIKRSKGWCDSSVKLVVHTLVLPH